MENDQKLVELYNWFHLSCCLPSALHFSMWKPSSFYFLLSWQNISVVHWGPWIYRKEKLTNKGTWLSPMSPVSYSIILWDGTHGLCKVFITSLVSHVKLDMGTTLAVRIQCYGIDREMPKNWWFWTVVLEKTLESPLDCNKIQPVHSKDQPWVFIGRTDIEAETPILWPPDAKSWLFGKDPDARKDWRQEEKGTTANEMVGWHHQLDGHEFEQALGVSDGQRSLVCYSSWGHKESETTEQLNWTEVSEMQFQSINQST